MCVQCIYELIREQNSYNHLHVRISFIVKRYFSVHVQFCDCHEHEDMFISWLKDNIHPGFVRNKFIEIHHAFVHGSPEHYNPRIKINPLIEVFHNGDGKEQ